MPKPIMMKWDLFRATVNVAESFSVINTESIQRFWEILSLSLSM